VLGGDEVGGEPGGGVNLSECRPGTHQAGQEAGRAPAGRPVGVDTSVDTAGRSACARLHRAVGARIE
jgi:hypothetical protein